ncbi:hypothetical protein OIU84_022703 [Salix udensis]|uniref:U6 snRNA-associated Sm-like protein LSm1 n=1 Tax=Salix udensis TaxID=889485 RepID=A0AAD6KP47_9ROSI|nr:hypothetical protein OIU84_022703 [Salix udensis]
MPYFVDWYLKIFSAQKISTSQLLLPAILICRHVKRLGKELVLAALVFLFLELSGFRLKKLLVLLRDGRKLMGLLRSFDQFANAVLEGACERVIVGDLYCDIHLGLYVIRGENVVLIGELDLEREDLPPHMTRVSEAEIRRAQKAEREATDLKGTMRKRMEFLDLD